jgi:hypothetical protein
MEVDPGDDVALARPGDAGEGPIADPVRRGDDRHGALWSAPVDGAGAWVGHTVDRLPGLEGHAAAALGPGHPFVPGGVGHEDEERLLCRAADGWHVVDLPVDEARRPCGSEEATLTSVPADDALVAYGGGGDRHCDAVWRFAPAAALACPAGQ